MRTCRACVWALVFFSGFASCATSKNHSGQSVQALEIEPDETIGVDDVFEVRVLGEADLSGDFRVAADGTVDYPYVGRVRLAGMRVGDVQQLITTKLQDGVLRNPQVTITIKEWNSRKVSVLGQVQKPGPVAYFPRMTIIDAIAAAGDFTGIAAKNSVTIRRETGGQVESKSYPVDDIREGRHPNVVVRPGDVIVVEERLF